ncbi:MAG: GH32 C-terminal domain-containing protein, partial [Ferruginibacter sp.]
MYTEQYRPQFHFSPATNWCNDPNGLVYNNGVYHLFYQHNPFGNVWGHMTWGHATSMDLIHWKHLPIAIPEENGVMIFSGTCVVDKNNTSGFGTNGKIPMVAVYTAHIENVNQSQHIAYSLDDGITWIKYANNPVLDLHKKDFRDPKIFWHQQKKYWVMALMFPVEHIVQFYSSKNLKEWQHLSDFGPAGDTSGVWECPDLTQVPVKGTLEQKKWLLQTSQNANMQYFVGEFDGVKFTNENPTNKIFRPDYGPDYYAAIAYNQLPATVLPTSIGWVNNWNYANDIPTTPWKSAMSIPRTLSVKKINNDWVLIQKPVAAIAGLRKNKITIDNAVVSDKKTLPIKSKQFEIECTIEPAASSVSGIRLATGTNNYFELGYDATKQIFYIDRSKSGNTT